jgi:1,4-dihydroxy-2-naphthoate octaprenyltransferase
MKVANREYLRNTIVLLRFPFSFFLLPVSLFSLYFVEKEGNGNILPVMLIWHLLVYPASNGFNSFHDRDKGPVGGLLSPPEPTPLLLWVVNCMDVLAILLALFVNPVFSFFVAVYIAFSRLYSSRAVRLKKFPLTGFLVVFIFQGCWIFCANILALSGTVPPRPGWICAAAVSSFFVGTMYPLTQVYQHKADREDGVKSLSMLLGIKGTFLFSALMFAVANLFMYLAFYHTEPGNFRLFNIVLAPATIYFLYWSFRSFRDPGQVSFRNTMIMLVVSSLLNNFFFLMLLLK